jgi:DNA-directed RNA polymerase I subunit RPA1
MFPERVTATNVEDLSKLVINGPKNYPGAHFIEENGRRILLERATVSQREAFARQLLDNAENKVVYRQLLNGDALLFNRQPTLHKNSMTVHQARVLNQGLTIRFHYANCSGYNADFDGDEMNLHFLQNHQARAEALNLALNDKQFILSTNKNPVRGLVQDYVFSPMLLSLKNVFLRRNEFFQLLYIALFSFIDKTGRKGLLGLDSFQRKKVENSSYMTEFLFRKIKVIHPAIVYPEELWTGKQLFSNIIKLVSHFGEEEEFEEESEILNQGIVMSKKTKINESYLCAVSKEDSKMIVRKNIIMTGIIDKNAVGTSKFGFVHSFFEIYGPHKTGILLSAFTKMCTNFLKLKGYTCGLGDLMLNEDFEKQRNELMGELHSEVIQSLSKMTKKSVPSAILSNPHKLFSKTQGKRIF